MNPCERIFIIGQQGAGKGLLAKSVAQSLGWQVVDADFGLETQIGRSLSDILGPQGSDAFYDCQLAILNALCTRKQVVIITDSTVVLSLRNRQLLRNEMTVFLDVSTRVQIERTSHNREPLLEVADLKEFFDCLHKERDSLYKEVATLTISSDDGKLPDHTLAIVDAAVVHEGSLLQKKTTLILEKKDFTLYHKEFHTKIVLSEQQALYLKLLAKGKTAKEIARETQVSYRTVEGMIARLIEVSGCSSSKELIALFYEQP